jgi:hypothetical protein
MAFGTCIEDIGLRSSCGLSFGRAKTSDEVLQPTTNGVTTRTRFVDPRSRKGDDDGCMSFRLQRDCVVLAASLVLVLTAAACGSADAGDRPSIRIVNVREHDFAIRAPHLLNAGLVRFVVTNKGPVSHELLLVRTPRAGLPMRHDGLTIDEVALGPSIVGVLEPGGPGSSRSFDTRLKAGRYILLCNMAGHYMTGMSSQLLVQ